MISASGPTATLCNFTLRDIILLLQNGFKKAIKRLFGNLELHGRTFIGSFDFWSIEELVSCWKPASV